MATMPSSLSASDASTQLIRAGSRTLAYRTIGEGPEMILCNRFRGTLDTWDPAFLDALAGNFTVIIFDYSGIGKSTGEPPSTFAAMAQDAMDLADELMIGSFIIGGWSMGGVAAQAVIATWPELISHAVLIGTNPPGPASRAGEPLFYEVATKPENDLEDEVVLFFEARSAKSRTAAAHSHDRIARRHSDVDPPVPPEVFKRILETVGPDIRGDTDLGRQVREALTTTSIPILILSGDHDLSFPVENWYTLSGKMPTAQHIVFPSAGHGPHHQYPDGAAAYITTFVRTSS